MSTDRTRPLHVLHVIARLNVGGAAFHVLQLAAEQRRRGHRPLVVAGTLAAGEESMEYLAEELGVPVRPLPQLQRELSLRRDAAAVRELVRIIRAERPDVLHTHAAKAGGTGRVAAQLALGARPRAVVHTFHGHVLRGYFGSRQEAVFRRLERLLARRTSALVAVSEDVRDELVALGVAPRERFEVIRYGFDLAGRIDPTDSARERTRARLGLTDGAFLIGWIGRLTEIKRPLDLVRTLRGVLDDGVDAALCLVGDGPDRPEVERLARALGVSDRCHLVGYQKETAGWYSAFDAFLLTSANEGTPVSAIEALAAARPVVATAVGGTPAVVEEGRSGFLAPAGDVDALAARLVELALDPELRSRLGRQGAERVRERYDQGRMVDEIEGLYRRLLAE